MSERIDNGDDAALAKALARMENAKTLEDAREIYREEIRTLYELCSCVHMAQVFAKQAREELQDDDVLFDVLKQAHRWAFLLQRNIRIAERAALEHGLPRLFQEQARLRTELKKRFDDFGAALEDATFRGGIVSIGEATFLLERLWLLLHDALGAISGEQSELLEREVRERIVGIPEWDGFTNDVRAFWEGTIKEMEKLLLGRVQASEIEKEGLDKRWRGIMARVAEYEREIKDALKVVGQ